MKTNAFIKAIAAICFILISAALIIAWDSPATGYEASIYAATPLLVWILLVFSIICGIAIIIHQLYTEQYATSKLWALGLFIILLSYMSILSLPVIRGYAFLDIVGDVSYHVGNAQNIIGSGHVTGNTYPSSIIFVSQLSLLVDLPVSVFIMRLPLIYTLIYIIFIYLLIKSVMPNKIAAISGAMLSILPLQGISDYFTPYFSSYLSVPMALFFLFNSFKKGAWQWQLLFIFTSVTFPPFHVLTASMLAVFLVFIAPARLVFDRLIKIDRKIIDTSLKFSAAATIILVISIVIWIYFIPSGQRNNVVQSVIAEQYSPGIPSSVQTLLEVSSTEQTPGTTGSTGQTPGTTGSTGQTPGTTGSTGQTPGTTGSTGQTPGLTDSERRAIEQKAEQTIAQLRNQAIRQKLPQFMRMIYDAIYAQHYGYSVIGYFFKLYGDALLYIILSLIAFWILWKTRQRRKDTGKLAALFGPFAIICLIIMVLLATALPLTPLRFIFFLTLMTAIIAGFTLSEFMTWLSSRSQLTSKLATLAIFILMVALSLNGVARLHASTYTVSPCYQNTRAEIKGHKWFTNNRNDNLKTSEMLPQHSFFANIVLPPDAKTKADYIAKFNLNRSKVPLHFSCDKKQPLISPADGASVSGTSVNFSWSASPGADNYWLIVRKVSDNSVKFGNTVGNVTTKTVTGFPADGTAYKWEVRPMNGATVGTSSAFRTFTSTGSLTAPMLGQCYTSNAYLLISARDRAFYTEIYPEVAPYRFLPSDFRQLKSDQSLSKIYQNSGFDAYYIKATK